MPRNRVLRCVDALGLKLLLQSDSTMEECAFIKSLGFPKVKNIILHGIRVPYKIPLQDPLPTDSNIMSYNMAVARN